MFPKGPIFFVHATTGCTCCRELNHYRGPYSTMVVAEGKISDFRTAKLTASQFSVHGNYAIIQRVGEILPDGRIIASGHVFERFHDDTDSILTNEDKVEGDYL